MSTADFSPEIMARDLAGNTTSSRLLVNAQARNFNDDKLTITDSFLDSKAEELAALCPDKETPLEQYLCVNTIERIANDEYLLQLGQKTRPTFLWAGPFLRLPRSAVKAGFADLRTYYYHNEKIDTQTHTGMDMASVAHAEVPATNAGHVVHAAPLGIYGNLVAVDHGIGLMSIYSHLTEIRVAEGDEVEAGQIVGTTGTTGLAGGDHVHYGILVGGIPVQPLEWLDPAWVRNNITNRLNTPL
jgi:murein DD-endopeptidase MepM/ murein hydrolase activator NlpD